MFHWNRVGSCNIWICLTAWTKRCQVLDQQAASQQLFSSELEAEAANVMWECLLPSLWTEQAVRSHCDAAIAGFHSHQTNTVEAPMAWFRLLDCHVICNEFSTLEVRSFLVCMLANLS